MADDLVADLLPVAPVVDLEVRSQKVNDWPVGGRLVVGEGARLHDSPAGHSLRAGELVEEAGFSDTRLSHDSDDLAPPGGRRAHRRAEQGQLVFAAHEAGQPARRRHLHRPARRAGPRDDVSVDQRLQASDRQPAERYRLDIALHQREGIGSSEDGTGLRHLLHAGGQVRSLPHRRVVHAEVTADSSNHYLPRVQAHPDLRLDPVHPTNVFRVPLDRVLHPQCGIACPHRVIFMG